MKKPPKTPKKTPYKLWGGRFEKATGEELETFSRSLHFDYRLALADIRGTKAYVRALERARILPREQSARSTKALDALARQAAAAGQKFFEGASEEDIHPFVLGKLRERI